MKITFYFRKKNPNAFSIEKLFSIIIEHLPVEIKAKDFYVPNYSSGIHSVLRNALSARKHQQDINHITGDIHYAALFLHKSKTILTIHDLLMLGKGSFLKKKILKWLWFTIPVERVKFITVISESTKRELLNNIKVDPEKIVVIPNCVDPNFKPVSKPFNEDTPIILVVGTKENKNLERIIKAVKGVQCKLEIIGKMPDHIFHLLEENNIFYENKYNLTDEEIKSCYIHSDLLLFVSLKEGFGLPILEAQAIGRPVITSNISSMPEVANDGALLVNPYNIQEITDAVNSLISDASLRETLVAKGYKNIENFQPETIAGKYYELYKKAISN